MSNRGEPFSRPIEPFTPRGEPFTRTIDSNALRDEPCRLPPHPYANTTQPYSVPRRMLEVRTGSFEITSHPYRVIANSNRRGNEPFGRPPRRDQLRDEPCAKSVV